MTVVPRTRDTKLPAALVKKLPQTGTLSLINTPEVAPTKEYIRYTPIQKRRAAPEERVIEVVDAVVDPFDPPKFRYKKQAPRAVAEPVPILHEPPRKLSKAEVDAWNIPPCISNWKNNRGYTIALDKRVAADGRHLLHDELNERHAEFAEALYLAEKAAAEENERKREMAQRVEIARKEKNEEELRELAMAFRRLRDQDEADRAFERQVEASRREDVLADEDVERREGLRDRRRQERAELYRRQKHADVLRDMERGRYRDVAEEHALGKKVESRELLFDQRLFNQGSGVSSGFADEGEYNLYDEELFKGSEATQLYRPGKGAD